uniref:Carbohydrate kinase PfkB domain-containing protein n=1 Tax=Streptomyces avermitilis TaxID=33903 RepID=A0A499W4H6_STRAX|nr:hypothetical protein SAVMC3_80980 [Streptomyces avermitilis]
MAAARLGRSTAVITRTGNDPFGTYLHQALEEFGVDDRFVTPVDAYPTPVTFCEIFPPDDFPLYFYRQPKAPDLEIRTEELDFFALRAARIFWITGTGLSEEPSRSATLAALKARTKGAPRSSTSTGARCSGRTHGRPARTTPRRCATRPWPSATSTSARSPPAYANPGPAPRR